MKVLNICRFLPIEGFPAENDITLKIYADLKKKYGVKSMFLMPLSHIPKWATYLKGSLKNRYKTINNISYIDAKYNLPIRFYQGFLPSLIKLGKKGRFLNAKLQFPLYKRELYNLVNNYTPDIVHAHTIDDAFYAYKIYKLFGIPYIITLRGKYSHKYELKTVKNILKYATKLVTPSYQLFLKFEKDYSIELIPHGINKEWYLEEKKIFNKTTLSIITVARLHDWKNIHTVIQSIANLIHKGHNIRYSIVGEGYYEEYLKELVLKNKIQDYVSFYGFMTPEELRKIYIKNDVFILLSYPETFGRVYFEAAAQGLLIVGRKNTGIDGYFTPEETFIIDPSIEDSMEVLKSIDKTIFDKMTLKSRKKILNFKNDSIIYKYHNILEKALSD